MTVSRLQDAGGLLAPVVQLQPVLLHPVRRHRLQPHIRPRCGRTTESVSTWSLWCPRAAIAPQQLL